MTKISPTYLYLRNDIYYFQLRLPKQLSHHHYDGKLFIRKSTRTGNKRDAAKIARKWWLQIMDDFDKTLTQTEDMEAALEKEDALYVRGKELHEILKSYDDLRDPRATDELTQHIQSQFDADALNFYTEYLRGQQSTVQHTQSAIKQNTSLDQHQFSAQNLSDIVQDYIEDRSNGPKAWTGKTRDKFEKQLDIFVQMLGNPSANDLTIALITKKYTNRIHNYPNNRQRQDIFIDKSGNRRSIEKLLQIGANAKVKNLSESSIWSHVSTIKSFLHWAGERDYVRDKLKLAFDKIAKPEKDNKIQRLPFSNEDLQSIFYHEHFTIAKSMRRNPERFWLPIVALYSGARLGELAQMLISDVKQDKASGIWYFDITDVDENGNESSKKKLKTKNAKRQIPIHTVIIALGFLKYVQFQKDRKQKQLFSKTNTNKHGDWGSAFSKWFMRHIKECGVKEDAAKVFHSFRHTVINAEKQLGLDQFVMSEVVGHSYDHNKVHGGYQQGFDLTRKKTELDKLTYDLDWSKIKKWQ